MAHPFGGEGCPYILALEKGLYVIGNGSTEMIELVVYRAFVPDPDKDAEGGGGIDELLAAIPAAHAVDLPDGFPAFGGLDLFLKHGGADSGPADIGGSRECAVDEPGAVYLGLLVQGGIVGTPPDGGSLNPAAEFSGNGFLNVAIGVPVIDAAGGLCDLIGPRGKIAGGKPELNGFVAGEDDMDLGKILGRLDVGLVDQDINQGEGLISDVGLMGLAVEKRFEEGIEDLIGTAFGIEMRDGLNVEL